jgi:hypothetical protein
MYSYTVNSDCSNRESEVNDWVIEATYLFERAAKVLEPSITPDAIVAGVENILKASSCLGTSDFKIVLS